MAKALPKNNYNYNSSDVPAIYKSGIDREDGKKFVSGFFNELVGDFFGNLGKSKDSLSAVKTTPDEILNQEVSKTSIESNGILDEIKEENIQQTTLLKDISKHMKRSEEDIYEEAVARENEMRLFEDIRDGINKLGEAQPLGDDDDSGESSATGIISRIKDGLLMAFAFLFNPRNLLKIISKIFAPVLIISTIAKGIFDGFKEFQESGSIKEALIAGLGGMLEFLTFGLFDKEKLIPVIDFMSDFVNDYIMDPLNVFMEFIGESFDKYIKQPIMSAFDWYVGNIKKFYIDPLMSVFDTLSDVIGNIVSKITGFLHRIEIPQISFSVVGKKFSFGPWTPFAPDSPQPSTVEDDFPKVIDTRSGRDANTKKRDGRQDNEFSTIDPSTPNVIPNTVFSEDDLKKDPDKYQEFMDFKNSIMNANLMTEYRERGFGDKKQPTEEEDREIRQVAEAKTQSAILEKYGKEPQVPIHDRNLQSVTNDSLVQQFTEVLGTNDIKAPLEDYERNREIKKIIEKKESDLGRKLLSEEIIKIKMMVVEGDQREEGTLQSSATPLMMEKLHAETPNTLSRLAKMSESPVPQSAMTAEMASELGKSIKINIPASPSQQSSPAIMQQPFTTKIPNGDPSLGRYMDKSFSW